MKFAKFSCVDVLIVLMFSFLSYNLITHWSDYSTCPAPMNIWLLGAYILITIARLLYVMIQTTEKPLVFKISIIVDLFPVLPALLIWIVLGSLWETQINSEAPGCIPPEQFPFLIVWWIGLCVFIAIINIVSLAVEINTLRNNERRLERFPHLRNTNDVFYRHFAIQTLLASDTEEEENAGNGLSPTEISLLKQFTFVQEEKNVNNENKAKKSAIFGDQELCCICLNAFLGEENLCKLPHCKHIFHSECLFQWLRKSAYCPYCKEEARLQSP